MVRLAGLVSSRQRQFWTKDEVLVDRREITGQSRIFSDCSVLNATLLQMPVLFSFRSKFP